MFRRILSLFLVLFVLDFASASAQSYLSFGQSTVVGNSAQPVTVTVTLPAGGSVASIQLFTEGDAGYDFSNASGGTCAAGVSYLAGQQCTVAVGFTPQAPGLRTGAVVLLDGNGAAIGTQFVVAMATGPLAVFVPGEINTVAGDSAWIYSGDGRPATSSAIFLPFGVAVNARGDLFIADSSNNRIRKVDATTGLIATIGGTGLIGATGDGGLAVNATLSNPSSIVLDPAGDVYFSDSGNNLVRRIDGFTGIITTIAGVVGRHGDTGDGGLGTSATLNTPNGISFGPAGNLYIADSGNNVIRLLNMVTGTISTIAGTGLAGYSGDGGAATQAQMDAPWGVTISGTGQVYLADQNNNRIRMVDSTGTITTVVGTGAAGFAGDGGQAIAAHLSVPASVAIDVAGNMYVADSGNNRVRKVDGQTGVIATIAGGNTLAFTGDTGSASLAGLYGPYTLTLDGQGDLFIADVFHNRIREISSNAAALGFAPQRVGRVSAPLTQMIENDGNAALTVGSILAVTNAQVNAAMTTCTLGQVLSVFGTCVVGVNFAPTTTGLLVTGTVTVGSNSGNTAGVLTLSGQVLDVDPATVVVTSSLNPATVGQTIPFLVTVSSAGTTPTGTVTLLDGTLTLAAAGLKSGVASFDVTTLAGGQHSITASYSGDTSNSEAVSGVLLETVTEVQAATVTTLTAGANPANAGAALVLTAGVSVAVPGSGTGTISGTVTFTEGSNVLGTATLGAGTAALAVTSLGVGTHTIFASYSGNTNYSASTSVAVVERVQLATSRVAASTSANPSIAGAALTLVATMLSNGGVPTGTVSFADGGAVVGTAAINGQGIATLVVAGTNWTVGTHTLTASYAGDTNNGGSVSQPVAQVVAMATTAVGVATSLNPAGLGGQVIFTATVTGNGGTPGGTVQFVDGSTTIGAGTISGAGVATFATGGLALGSHTIVAVYAGDAYDSGATSTGLVEVVAQATTAVGLVASANPANFGAALTLTATVSGTGSAPTGTVTFTDATQGAALGTVGLVNGVALFTTSALTIGTHNIVAQYGGDTNHLATVSTTLSERVVQATTTGLTASSGRAVAGTAINFTAAVSGANGNPVSGNVTFSDGGTTLATTTIAGGTAVYSTSALAPGQHAIVATYLGDALDATSSSAAMGEAVTIASSAVTLTTSANPSIAGSALTLTATVTGNGGIATGSVTFLDGGTVLTAAVLNAAGVATLTTAGLAPGIHLLTASYAGDTDDAPALSAAVSEQVAEKTSVTLATTANPALLTDNVTITVAVGNGFAATLPTGAVTLTDGGVPVGTQQLNAGAATFTLNAPTLGTHTLVANYAGDSENIAASATLLQTVTLRPSTTALTPSTTALSNGQQLIFYSIVTAAGPRVATGQVTFASGGTVLGVSTLSAAGLATLTVIPAQGTYNVAAQYSGDGLYAASASAGIAIVVGPPIEFTLTAPTAMTMQSGQHGVMQISVASAPTFSDTLAFGCAGLPASATCTFSSDQVKVSGGVAQTLSVTVDTGNPLGAGGVAAVDGRGRLTACALPFGALFALLLWRSRRTRQNFRALGLLTMVLALAAMSMLSGCASSLSVNDTPAGSYTFQIVAAGAATGATGTAGVALTVTK